MNQLIVKFTMNSEVKKKEIQHLIDCWKIKYLNKIITQHRLRESVQPELCSLESSMAQNQCIRVFFRRHSLVKKIWMFKNI